MSHDRSLRRAVSAPSPASEAATHYAAALIERAAGIRLPALFARRRAAGDDRAIHRSRARRGIQAVAVATDALREEELVAIMRYRLAQYLSVHFVDHERIFRERIEYEPLDHTSPHDVHIITGSADTGEIYCYMTLKQVKGAPPGATFRTRERPLFPVEEVHGWGIFNRLAVLPDLPVDRVREVGRFVKNRRYQSLDERSIRGPLETALALWHIVSAELRPGLDALVGDFEEGIAMQNLAFFHVPMAVLHGTVPYEAETAWLYRRYRHRTVFPFAVLLDDLAGARARCASIDRALSLPGKLALLRLSQLRGRTSARRSSLEPPGGLPAIDEALVLLQPEVEMDERLRLIDEGRRLRAAPLFADLSVAEATVLGTKLERLTMEPGTPILRAGEAGDALFVVESGTVEVRAGDAHVGTLGPGDHFGEIALLTGGARTADVVAATPLTVLRLSRDDYLAFLAELPDITGKAAASSAVRVAALGSGGHEAVRPGAPALLADLTAAEATVLGRHMQRLQVAAGEVVVRQGAPGDGLYLILAGEARVAARDAGGRRRELAVLGPGEFFGEIAMLSDAPRVADVEAASPMTVLRLDRAGFAAFLAYSERARANLGEAAAARRLDTARRLASEPLAPEP